MGSSLPKSDEDAVFINGRFLSQNQTGVQRYSRQVVAAIDRVLSEGSCSPAMQRFRWYLLAPPGTKCDLDLRCITFLVDGRGGGHLWEQVYLSGRARSARVLSPANSGPLFHRKQLLVLHDAAVYHAAVGYSVRYRTFHQLLGRLLAKRARLATVSRFSRRELATALGVAAGEILIARNGADHLAATLPDDAVIERLCLGEKNFFVTVGLSSANKNIPLAIEAFRRLNRPDARLVIVGTGNEKVVAKERLSASEGIIFAGRLSDSEIVSLLQRAAAFVFPSRYEGFGIPSLEAMIRGCPVLASTAEALLEVCGDAALHFNPDDADALATLMQHVLERPSLRTLLRERGLKQHARYRWDDAARTLMQGIETLA